jgi:hypothetical protein
VTKVENLVTDTIASEIKIHRLQARNAELALNIKALHEALHLSEKRYDALCEIGEPVERIRIPRTEPKGDREATAFVIYSDWHVEEVVDPKTVNGKNAYNPEIAERRMKVCLANTMKRLAKAKRDVSIDRVVLGLLGDFITGYIHEEFPETNALSPIEATLFAKQLLTSAIDTIASEYKNTVIVCTYGNHGRTTKKKRTPATHYKNSYEWMMYQILASHYKGQLEFVIPKSNLALIPVYDEIVRFSHGDDIQYQGGIGGVSIPLTKWVHRANATERATMDFMGHWHQRFSPLQSLSINGSLIGYNAYALQRQLIYQPPLQMMSILDSVRGWTIEEKIFCE